MLISRKLKSCTKKRFYLIFFGFSSITLMLVFLINSRNICIQQNILYNIKKLCETDIQTVYGDLCHDICLSKSINSFHCGNGIYNDYRLMFANRNHNQNIIFKEIKPNIGAYESLFWKDKYDTEKFPTKVEFSKLIQRSLLFNYNMTLPADKLGKLLAFIDNSSGGLNQQYMESVWNFIHTNEYILAVLMDKEEVFPKVLGMCGNFYAREYEEPIVRNVKAGDLSLYEWRTRIKASILILDYIDEIYQYQNSYVMCDANILYFYIANDRIKYHDVDSIYPREIIDKTLSNAKPCNKDTDCHFKSCLSKCDLTERKCINKQMNNNLHVVCTKMLRGVSSYTPGILITSYTSQNLLNLLERCVKPENVRDIDPEKPFGPSKYLRDQLYSELANIYEVVYP